MALMDIELACANVQGVTMTDCYGNDMNLWLVVSTPLKNMSSSIGMMKFPIYGKIKVMFQSTNQISIW